MSDNELDEIAEEVGAVVETQQDSDGDKIAREGDDDFDPEEYRRGMEDYDGGF